MNDDEATLRHFKTVLWPQAYRTQDVELPERMLHDSFQMIDAEGNRSTKQGEHLASEVVPRLAEL